MSDWMKILAALADSPADFVHAGSDVAMVRQGRDRQFSLVTKAGIGLVACTDQEPGGVPISTFIQRDLLELPRLAQQVVKHLDRSFKDRSVRFVDGPAELQRSKVLTQWARSKDDLQDFLLEHQFGATHLIQLMADAGAGKTVLLEQAALNLARNYTPVSDPSPLLLVVDLLGRYVGTVDDAIAGSLNNTYLFPQLSQRDVALAVSLNWIVLALDGFDELVARVGSRDAFNRITDLIDQLNEGGTVVLSARRTFFELFQISSAIRSYLQPIHGSYSTSIIRLQPWERPQGIAYFRQIGSSEPERELEALLAAFPGDEQLVLHPFFLTRLASLWMKGERFTDLPVASSQMARTAHVIDMFVRREVSEKWRDREGVEILSKEGHVAALRSIAEEMWRSGAFTLDEQEVRIATEIGLEGLGLPRPVVDDVSARMPTHGVLISKGRGLAFIHDRFFQYFFGTQVGLIYARRDLSALKPLLEQRDLGPEVLAWAVWQAGTSGGNGLLDTLTSHETKAWESTGRVNFGSVLAGLLDALDSAGARVVGQVFSAQAFRGVNIAGVVFLDCDFWQLDLGQASLRQCRFERCRFGPVLIDGSTSLEGCTFVDYEIHSLSADGAVAFGAEIPRFLKSLGALLPTEEAEDQFSTEIIVDQRLVAVTERAVRLSEETCDVALEDLEDEFGVDARTMHRVALESEVARAIVKAVRGPRRTFFRFRGDRDLLLAGRAGITGNAAVDAFWRKLAEKA